MLYRSSPFARGVPDRSSVGRLALGPWTTLLVVAVAVLGFSGFGPLPSALTAATPVAANVPVIVTPGSPTTPTAEAPSSAPLPIHLGELAPDPLAAFQHDPSLHTPAAWQGHPYPPGAESLRRLVQSAQATRASPTSGNASDPLGQCFGVWPTQGGQGIYSDDCYGHDEPGITFYSSLAGSGGNQTWNVRLPVARTTAVPQSTVYTAIWFGLTFTDPYAWMDQCFLELQFYPDSSWGSGGLVYGNWVGAAVAWQIEASTGFEDACFYEPMYLDGTNGSSTMDMTAGDNITVNMSGFYGSPLGEQLVISDLTSGANSTIQMYNYAQNYPLDPAFVSNSVSNGLQWTPGGEYPGTFAFEIAHPISPYPGNNSYGGCSSGPPPSTPQDPAVPCPSYDPGSWDNATLLPWEIAVPTFYNATTTVRPSQVEFTQDLGGLAVIDPLSNGTCDGIDWTAWCSYPWYSYSCERQGFEYGALNYPGYSEDFGKSLEFDQNYVLNGMQLGYYDPLNFSVPTCGAPSYTATVGPSGPGSAYFLSTPVATSTPFPALGAGEYSIGAIPTAGAAFLRWDTTGGLSVAAANDPQTSLWVAGNGTVTAVFSAAAVAGTTVTFHDLPAGGWVTILPRYQDTPGGIVVDLTDGQSAALVPGEYGLQSNVPSGYNFTGWTVSGAGGSILAPGYPYTWLLVTAANDSLAITNHAATSASKNTIYYGSYGSGTVSLDGGSFVASGSASVHVGTHALVASPSSGYSFSAWYTSGSAFMSRFEANSNVTLEDGASYLYAYFVQTPIAVTFAFNPASAATVSIDAGSPVGASTQSLLKGSHSLIVAPTPGYGFSGFIVSNGARLWISSVAGGGDRLVVNNSGTVTVVLAAATNETLGFATTPAAGGTVGFNYGSYSNGDVLTTVAVGVYYVTATANPGYVFSGWQTSGSVSLLSADFVNVTGSGGTLTALFDPGTYLVTFVADAPYGLAATIDGVARGTGESVWVTGGLVPYNLTLPSGMTFQAWDATPGISASGGLAGTLTVHASGTLELVARGFIASATFHPGPVVDFGEAVTFQATVIGPDQLVASWTGLPPGCANNGLLSLTCRPNASGNFTIGFSASTLDAQAVSVPAGTLSVVPALVIASYAATPTSFTLGHSTTLSVAYHGGIGPYTVVYSGLPVGCFGANTSTLVCTPTSAGTSDVTISVIDAAQFQAFESVEITVNTAPSLASFVVDRPAVDAGVPVQFTAVASGGTHPLTVAYTGLPPGCASVDALTFGCVPTTAGNYTISVSVTDLSGTSVSGSVHLVVVRAPTIVGFAASSSLVVVNGSVQLTVELSGGTAPFTYQYANLPFGCASRNVSSIQCIPRAVGNFTATVTVTDAFGLNATASVPFTVETLPPPPPPVVPASSGGGWTITDTLLLVAALVAVAIVAAIVVARRRRPPVARVVTTAPATPLVDDEDDFELPRFDVEEPEALDLDVPASRER